MRSCDSCTENADVVYLPGNVEDGNAYCARHFPKHLHALFGTESVVPAGFFQSMPVVEEEVTDTPEEPVVAEEPKRKRRKASSSEETVVEPEETESVAEDLVVEEEVTVENSL